LALASGHSRRDHRCICTGICTAHLKGHH